MNGRIEREEWFQDDPHLVDEMPKPKRPFNWQAIYAVGMWAVIWGGMILAWLWRKGWL